MEEHGAPQDVIVWGPDLAQFHRDRWRFAAFYLLGLALLIWGTASDPWPGHPVLQFCVSVLLAAWITAGRCAVTAFRPCFLRTGPSGIEINNKNVGRTLPWKSLVACFANETPFRVLWLDSISGERFRVNLWGYSRADRARLRELIVGYAGLEPLKGLAVWRLVLSSGPGWSGYLRPGLTIRRFGDLLDAREFSPFGAVTVRREA